MTHTSDDAISARMDALDMHDRQDIIAFCKECYVPLVATDRFTKFALDDFAASLPSVDEYLKAGDYTGAGAKIGLGIYAAMIDDGVLAPFIEPISKTDIFDDVPIMKGEDDDFVANTLAMVVARTIAHAAICENHDIGNPYAFFGELRYAFAQVFFDVSDKYAEVSKSLGALMVGAMKSKGAGYIEKNPILTYHLSQIEKAIDEAPVPATSLGMAVSDAIAEIKKVKDNYPSYSTGMLSAAMMYIQFGIFDLATAESINQSVSNYVDALQDAA